MDTKYHYVILGYSRDYFRVMFQDAIEQLEVEYIDDPIANGGYCRFLVELYHLHNNPYLNWRWQLPLKKIWFNRFYNKHPNKTLCFVFLMDWVMPQYRGLIDVMKGKYPDAKFVVYLEDLVTRHSFDLEEAKKFDLCISYDKTDAERYGFEYLPTFLSKVNVISNENHSNCNFVGLPKNRIDIINQLFHTLTKGGLVCDFVIPFFNEKKQQLKGIKYTNNSMTYLEYLQHVVNTDCIVEVMQKNAVGYTLRTWEALLYGKKLLTNNSEILNAPFYNENQFIYFEDPTKIDVAKIMESIVVPYFDANLVSPLKLFNLIEEKLAL